LKIALIYLGRKGGGAVYSLEIARALGKKEDVLAVISSQVENLDLWESSGIKILKVSTFNNLWQVIPSTLNIVKIINLIRNIKKFHPDVIYYPMGHLWGNIINFALGNIPKVVTRHDPIANIGDKNILVEFFGDIFIKTADRVIILSKSLIDIMVKMGFSESKIDVIPHGDFSYYAKNSFKKKEYFTNTILFFGRISKYKGMGILLKAFKIVEQRIKNASLLIVGNGNLKPYNSLIKSCKNVEIVNRWIKDDEIPKYFKRSDFLVAPYIDASQSGVIKIANAFSMPVIASNIGGLPEQVDNNKTGYLVEPGNEFDLAEKCIKLLKNKELIISMGENALKKEKSDYNWDKISDLVLEVFRKAMKK